MNRYAQQIDWASPKTWIRAAIGIVILVFLAWIALYLVAFMFVAGLAMLAFFGFRRLFVDTPPNDYSAAADAVAMDDAAEGRVIDGEFEEVDGEKDQ